MILEVACSWVVMFCMGFSIANYLNARRELQATTAPKDGE